MNKYIPYGLAVLLGLAYGAILAFEPFPVESDYEPFICLAFFAAPLIVAAALFAINEFWLENAILDILAKISLVFFATEFVAAFVTNYIIVWNRYGSF